MPWLKTSGSPCPWLRVRHRAQGSSCPSAGCRVYPSLSRLQRPLHCRLSSPGLLVQHSHSRCLLSDLSSDTSSPCLSPCPLALLPCIHLPSVVFLPSFPCPRVGKPHFNQKKEEKVTDSIYISFQQCVHKHTHISPLSPSLSPSDRLAQ